MDHKTTWITLGLCAGVLLTGGLGAAYALFINPAILDQSAAPETQSVKTPGLKPKALSETQKREVALAQDFEDTLNNFLRALQTGVRDYKGDRVVLQKISEPFNLRTPVYVQENYELLKAVTPDLRAQMDGVFQVFEQTEQKITAISQGLSETRRDNILERWRDLKTKQLALYVDYFSYEEKILQNYEALMTFYHTHQNQMIFDEDYSAVEFSDPAVNQERDNILEEINTNKELQKSALKANAS